MPQICIHLQKNFIELKFCFLYSKRVYLFISTLNIFKKCLKELRLTVIFIQSSSIDAIIDRKNENVFSDILFSYSSSMIG